MEELEKKNEERRRVWYRETRRGKVKKRLQSTTHDQLRFFLGDKEKKKKEREAECFQIVNKEAYC